MLYSFKRDQLDAATDHLGPRPSNGRTRAARVGEPTLDDIIRFADVDGDDADAETETALPVAANCAAPTLADRYVLRRVVGRGGMATVFEAYDRVLAREVAIKVLTDPDAVGPDTRKRFLAEARITASLRHPNIVEVLDFRTTSTDVAYLTMELLRGETLHARLKRVTRMSWPEVRALMLDICAGLETVHAAGIVHRDLKPSNCLCVRPHFGERDRDQVRLLDFGIATRIDPDSPGTGEVIGTPEYMAPEQVRGGPIDARADIYAAGLILGELLTGRLPFDASTPATLLIAHLYEPIPRLSELAPAGVRIPAALERVYARATSRDPEDRYPDIRSFADALCAIEDEDADADELLAYAALSNVWTRLRRAQRRSWMGHALAASVALTIGIGATLSFGSPGQTPPTAAAHERRDAVVDARAEAHAESFDDGARLMCGPMSTDEDACHCSTQTDQASPFSSAPDRILASSTMSRGLTSQ